MVHWGWLVVTAMASGSFGFVMFAIFSVNRDNKYEDNGYHENERGEHSYD